MHSFRVVIFRKEDNKMYLEADFDIQNLCPPIVTEQNDSSQFLLQAALTALKDEPKPKVNLETMQFESIFQSTEDND